MAQDFSGKEIVWRAHGPPTCDCVDLSGLCPISFSALKLEKGPVFGEG